MIVVKPLTLKFDGAPPQVMAATTKLVPSTSIAGAWNGLAVSLTASKSPIGSVMLAPLTSIALNPGPRFSSWDAVIW